MGARGKIFISYRRDDAPGDARGIRDRLAGKFGKANVFMDVDNLLAGQRFDRELEKALSQCDVLIAVIGPRWMKLLSGHTRSSERDYVHDEIAEALKRDITVIPTLVGRKGHMPSLPNKDNLPEDIRALILHHKQDIAHESFGRDAEELVEAVKFVLRGGRPVRSWRTIAISGVVALFIAMGLLGYWLDLIPPKTGPNVPQPIFAARSNSDADRAAADAAAKNKAAEETGRKAAEAKQQVEADAAKKAEEEARRQVEAEVAKKKTQEEAAGKRAAADCDRLAASPFDMTRPSGVPGVYFEMMDATAATAACDDAIRRYPETTRFVFQAARVAHMRNDFAKAVDLYRAAIAKDSTAAMVGLGLLYSGGQGVPLDYAEARRLLEKAASLGAINAMTGIGLLYLNGQGVTQNDVEARKWFEKAAALGDPYAVNALGFIYAEGRGVKQDYGEARRQYDKAAAMGQIDAMYNLGRLYENGFGVAQDYTEARKWYEKAAGLGHTNAMFNLGILYENGRGVAKDRERARGWYQKAADAGNEQAKAKLKDLK